MDSFLSQSLFTREVSECTGHGSGGAASRLSARDQKVLKAAERLFLQKGCQQISLAEVAVSAGIGTRTMYDRFRHKHALLEAVIEAQRDGAAQELAVFATTCLPLEGSLQRLAVHACLHELAPPVDLFHADMLAERDPGTRVRRDWAFAGPWRALLERTLQDYLSASGIELMSEVDTLADLFAAFLMREHAATGPCYADDDATLGDCEVIAQKVVARFLVALPALMR